MQLNLKHEILQRWFVLGVITTCLLTVAGVAPAGAAEVSYPSRNITFLTAVKPGGGIDTSARVLTPYIKKYLPRAVNIIVENHAAAGGKVGALKMFEAKPDGYTIGIYATSSLALLNAMGDFGKSNPADLVYLGRTGSAPYTMVISARSRFKNIQAMKGEQVKFGGTAAMVFGSMLLGKLLDTKVTYVSYDGFPETAMATMRGDIDAFFTSWASTKKNVDASEGRLIPVFVADDTRIPQWVSVPTYKEVGLELDEMVLPALNSTNLVVAPPGLPTEVRVILEKAISSAVQDKEAEAQMFRATNYSMQPFLPPKGCKELATKVNATYLKYKDLLLTPR